MVHDTTDLAPPVEISSSTLGMSRDNPMRLEHDERDYKGSIADYID